MSDLRGFTALSAKLTAEELITVINHYFEAMSNIITKYGRRDLYDLRRTQGLA